MIETEDVNGNYVVADTILAAIEKARVFSVEKHPDGSFKIKEKGDDYYRVYLTRDQLHQLADELKALADT